MVLVIAFQLVAYNSMSGYSVIDINNISDIQFSDIQWTHKLLNSATDDSFMPVIGLGCSLTYKRSYSSAQKWLSIGGRHFDESYCYNARNGLIDSVLNYTKHYKLIPRSDIFIVSKVGGCVGDNLGYNEVINWFNAILSSWNTTYIDVILLHWPSFTLPYLTDMYTNQKRSRQKSKDPSCLAYFDGTFGANYNATECRLKSWKALIELYLKGVIKAIGVSNFGKKHLYDLINYKHNDGKYYVPTTNQIQFHGYNHEYGLVNFCKKYNIQVSAWSPLGSPHVQRKKWNGDTPVLTQHPIVINISKKYNKSTAQVWLRWQKQLDIIPIVSSNNINHMIENINIFDFKLDNNDMRKLSNIDAPVGSLKLVYRPDPNDLP